MPETGENWFGLINSCIYYAHQTREIYQALPYSSDFKAHRKYLVNLVLFWNKHDKGPVNIWNNRKPHL